MRIVLFVAGVLLAAPSFPATISVSWAHPTRNVDGSRIPPSGDGSIASTRVEWGTCLGQNGFGAVLGDKVVSGTDTTTRILDLQSEATYCIRAYSRNNNGEESAASKVVARRSLD